MGKIINWAIVIGIGYFLYTYFGSGDVTFIPPQQAEVQELATKHDKNAQGGALHLSASEKCKRVGGGWLKQGIYSCEIKAYKEKSSYSTPVSTYDILLEKKNNKWQVKSN